VGGLLGEDEVENETIVVMDEIVSGNACDGNRRNSVLIRPPILRGHSSNN